jgi:hypothetical protein
MTKSLHRPPLRMQIELHMALFSFLQPVAVFYTAKEQ